MVEGSVLPDFIKVASVSQLVWSLPSGEVRRFRSGLACFQIDFFRTVAPERKDAKREREGGHLGDRTPERIVEQTVDTPAPADRRRVRRTRSPGAHLGAHARTDR